MQEPNNDVTDVEIKSETLKEEKPVELFNPVSFLTEALLRAGYANPTGWTLDIDPRAISAENEKERIFFANRALRLYISEQHQGTDVDTIAPRMLLADGIDSKAWMALMEQGIVPWLMGGFDKKGKVKSAKEPAIPEFPEAPPVPPVCQKYTGELNLSEEDKEKLREFFKNGEGPEITLGDITFFMINRDGTTCREWSFVGEPSVSYPLKYEDFAASQNLAPEDSSVAVFEAELVETLPSDVTDAVEELQDDQRTGSSAE